GFLPDGRFAVTHDLDGIQVWDARTGKSVWTRPMPEKVRSEATPGTYAGCLAFTPDGKRLATGHPDGTILLWDVPLPPARPEPLAAGEGEALWADLKAEDAGAAWRAAWRLAELPEAALPLFREQLKPVQPAAEGTTGPLLADLDSEVFAQRQAAQQRLQQLGPPAEPPLPQPLEGNP